MSKKTNIKNQEKLKLYLQKNEYLQSDNKANKRCNTISQADKKLLQGISDRLFSK